VTIRLKCNDDRALRPKKFVAAVNGRLYDEPGKRWKA